MHWTKPGVFLLAIGLVVWAIGALVSLVVRFGDGGNGTAILIVVALLVASLVVMLSLGAKGPAWLRNPRHYW